jgi:type I restriction enzyme S subunit
LPKSWVCCTLGSISSIISKGTTPRNKNSYCNNGIGFLRIENINDNFTISKKDMKYITQEVNDFELKRSILQHEDIIISIAGTLGKMAIIKQADLPLNTNQAISFIRLINTKLVNTMFIIYYLQSSVVKSQLLSKAKVTAIPNLTLELLSNTCINLPPILEQKRIVDTIENLFIKIEQIKDSL